jgi:hypothetical protein
VSCVSECKLLYPPTIIRLFTPSSNRNIPRARLGAGSHHRPRSGAVGTPISSRHGQPPRHCGLLCGLLTKAVCRSVPLLYSPFSRHWPHAPHVQSDPYAPPSRCRIAVPGPSAAFPSRLYSSPIRSEVCMPPRAYCVTGLQAKTVVWVNSLPRRTALADYLARQFTSAISKTVCGSSSGGLGSAGGHYTTVCRPGPV